MLEPLEARVPTRTPRLERIAPSMETTQFANCAQEPILARLIGSLSQNVDRMIARIEDPARLVKFTRLELEGNLLAVLRAQSKIERDINGDRRAVASQQAVSVDWQSSAEVALAHGRDDLAPNA